MSVQEQVRPYEAIGKELVKQCDIERRAGVLVLFVVSGNEGDGAFIQMHHPGQERWLAKGLRSLADEIEAHGKRSGHQN